MDYSGIESNGVSKKSEKSFKITSPCYTQIPNVLLDDWLPYLTLAELRILLTVYRKTFGYHKRKDRISLSQLEKQTGIGRKHITIAIEKLKKKNLIRKKVTGKIGQETTTYEVVICDENDENSIDDQWPKATPPSGLKPPPNLGKRTSGLKPPTKETYILKEKEKEKSEVKTSIASQDAHICACYLFDKLKERRQERKKPDFKKWGEEFERIIRIDKIPKAKIIEAIDFVNRIDNPFNVQSPSSLRQKYENIADHLVLEGKIKEAFRNTAKGRSEALEQKNKVRAGVIQNNRKWAKQTVFSRHVKCHEDRVEVRTTGKHGKESFYIIEYSDEKFKEKMGKYRR